MLKSTSTSPSGLDSHYYRVVQAITDGNIVPFLGDEINVCGRETQGKRYLEDWGANNETPQYPPTNTEIALYLDKNSGCYSQSLGCPLLADRERECLPPDCPIATGLIEKLALQQVSQYIDLLEEDPDFLSATLDQLFNAEYSTNPLHQFLAALPKLLRDKGYPHPYQLLVTTCFDSTLEQAFKEKGEPFDLVSFVNGSNGGYFTHQRFIRGTSSTGESTIVELSEEGNKKGFPYDIIEPNTYDNLSLDRCSIILKLYGRGLTSDREKFVITEDQYIDYLAHRDIGKLLPTSLLKKLEYSNILFLGYRPSDWNLRGILRRLWPKLLADNRRSWAVQSGSEMIDQKFWERYTGRKAINLALGDYIAELDKRIQELPPKAGSIQPHQHSSGSSSAGKLPAKRDKIFISYSHQDKEWLEKLKTMLTPAIGTGIVVWDDTQIETGEKWQEKIEEALATAKVAVLLVSANFLHSQFIAKEELPPLLEAAKNEGLTIAWVHISECLYDFTDIKDYQAAHDISKPLDSLSESETNQVLSKISRNILNALKV
jgi:hypothetical protein